MKMSPAKSVDEYLQGVASGEARSTLQALRSIILEVVPDAAEVISYGIPSYKFNKTMVSFAAFKNHCSFFPGHTVRDFLDELSDYKTAKGTIQFPMDRLPPKDLLVRILRARFFGS